jgi:hypothetical protein
MRRLMLVVVLISVAAKLPGAGPSPFFLLAETVKNGSIHITGKNISGKAIVAYVVVADSAHQRTVWHGVYTEGDTLRTGAKITVGDIPVGPSSAQVNVVVDYVRLADGTTWGDAATDQSRDISARYQTHHQK